MNLPIRIAAKKVLTLLRSRNEILVTAESCTGGLIAGALTAVPGISEVFWGGYIVYANSAKLRLLGVDPALLERFGAVSDQTARAMASGALTQSGILGVSLAVTGIAGPAGGSVEKPVGTVCFCLTRSTGEVLSDQKQFRGSRDAVRCKAVLHALKLLIDFGSC